MKVVGVMEKIGEKWIDRKRIKEFLGEYKGSWKQVDSRTVVNGAVGLVLLVGAVAIISPVVKAQLLQRSDVGSVEMVVLQEGTADFLKLNTMAVNYANVTLADVYTYVQSGFSEGQRDVLVAKRSELLKYKDTLTPSNPIFLPMSENSVQKLTLLISAIDAFLDQTTPEEEDMVKLNVYTSEYQKASEAERQFLIAILDQTGMNYELLDNGQIKYSYLGSME
jgi:hypothetical protein